MEIRAALERPPDGRVCHQKGKRQEKEPTKQAPNSQEIKLKQKAWFVFLGFPVISFRVDFQLFPPKKAEPLRAPKTRGRGCRSQLGAMALAFVGATLGILLASSSGWKVAGSCGGQNHFGIPFFGWAGEFTTHFSGDWGVLQVGSKGNPVNSHGFVFGLLAIFRGIHRKEGVLGAEVSFFFFFLFR